MFKKKMMLWVLIIIGLGIFSGCSSGIRFNIGYEDKGSNNRFVYTDDVAVFNLVKIINSLEELKAFCDEVNNPAFNEESLNYSSDLSRKIREYDETFFAEKSLIIYLTSHGDTSVSYSIKGLEIENEELLLDIRIKKHKGLFTHVFTPWVFIIEVNKEDIAGITNIRIS